ncbi:MULTISPECIES: DUF5994 family protein [unclassified Streptomyces]|uniref:DUF5994 family protein n=1 Tax=unclassified Streptomyces TaxID=2593676 RepID=UPI00352F4196
MTVLAARTPPTALTAQPSGHPPFRLSLRPPGPHSGLLDGAWWPRSRDLARELPALTDLLDPLWGRITRVTANPTYWPVAPRKVTVNGHVVKVGWFRAEQDPHQLMVLSYHVGRWDLLIIPPETGAAAAARLMAAACDPRIVRTGSALIADELDRHPAAPAEADPQEQSADGHVEVRIVAANPDAARQVAQLLSRFFVCDEPRSYPTGSEGGGTRLHLTADTLLTQVPDPAPRSWLAESRSQAQRTHVGEMT